MSFVLTMANVIVGRSELEHRDPDRHVATGAFRPGLGYELAQPVFALYDAAGGDAAALARYRNARDALRLKLTDPSGRAVPVSDLHLRQRADGVVLEIETDDPVFWTTPSPSTR